MAESESKKRKRPANGPAPSPNKKVAFSQQSAATKLAVTFLQPKNELRCVVASSPGLSPPAIAFNAYARSGNKQDLVLQSSQHPRLDYTAAPSALDAGLAHYVALFDPKNNQIQVVPAQHLNLRGTLRQTAEEEAAAVGQRGPSLAQQREALGREFGTKKAKKAIASKTENAIISDTKGKGNVTATQTAILEAVGDATAGAATKEELETALLASKPIPPPNLDADNVEDVYKLDVLLPPHEAKLVTIRDWQEAAKAKTPVDFDHRFPAYRMQKIGELEDVDRLKALRYLSLLLQFHDAMIGGKMKKVPAKAILQSKLEGFPAALVDSVRRRFTNDTGTELGKFQLDKLYTHICALSLYVDRWMTDTTNLKDDLKLETRAISKYFQELGCVVKAPTETERNILNIKKNVAAVTRVARLKLPLAFPKVSRRRA